MVEGRGRAGCREAGFSLLEMMVAMALLALVAGLLFSSGRLLGEASERIGARQVRVADRVTGLDVMRVRLAEAMRLDFGEPDGYRAAFAGDASGFRLVAPRSDDAPGHPLLVWEFRIVGAGASVGAGAGEAARLAVRFAEPPPDAADFAALAGAEWRPLMRLGEGAAFAYHGRLDEKDESAWHAAWRDQPRMPRAVRLTGGAGAIMAVPVGMPVRTTTPPFCASADTDALAGCGDG